EESYKRIINGNHYVAHRKSGEQKTMRVAVYSSDGCPWCSKAKSYLKKVGIPFRDVNVSHDENAAKDIFRRSGQMGTPQIDINGQIIVGFDQPKIDKLLGLN
ncbi:MAG: glutaredoxin domain-containing protein, partial [Thermodesulfobacteriota bacterium]|nr:glutaredoxin domain-containing protein [Thermodesulfobacteriota bacterium]